LYVKSVKVTVTNINPFFICDTCWVVGRSSNPVLAESVFIIYGKVMVSFPDGFTFPEKTSATEFLPDLVAKVKE
jgi:hypothetical protein